MQGFLNNSLHTILFYFDGVNPKHGQVLIDASFTMFLRMWAERKILNACDNCEKFPTRSIHGNLNCWTLVLNQLSASRTQMRIRKRQNSFSTKTNSMATWDVKHSQFRVSSLTRFREGPRLCNIIIAILLLPVQLSRLKNFAKRTITAIIFYSKNQIVWLFHIATAQRQFVQTTFRTIAKNPTFRTRTIGTKMKPDISYKRHFVQN